MPVIFTDDQLGTIGQSLGNLAGAYGNAGSKFLEGVRARTLIEENERKRREEQRLLEEQQRRRGLIEQSDTARRALDAVPQLPRNVQDVPIPSGFVGPQPPPDVAQREYQPLYEERQRVREPLVTAATQADRTFGLNLVTTPEQLANMSKVEALGDLRRGFPTAPDIAATMQTQLTHQLPGQGTQRTPHNYRVDDPSTGQLIDAGITYDGRTNSVGRIIPPGRLSLTSPAPAASATPNFDEAAMRQHLFQTAQTVGMGGQLTYDQALKVSEAIGKLHGEGIPPVYRAVVQHAEEVLRAGPRPSEAPAAAPAPASQVAPQLPPVGAQLSVAPPPTGGPMVTGPAATTAEPIEPIVPGRAAPAVSDERMIVPKVDTAVEKLTASPIFRRYQVANSAYSAMAEASKDDNLASDLQMIYMLAKMYDPDSAVREGELHMAQATGSVGERLTGLYSALSKGGGRLSLEMRRDMLQEAHKAATEHWRTANTMGQVTIGTAIRRGADPRDLPVITPPEKFDERLINSRARQPVLRSNDDVRRMVQ